MPTAPDSAELVALVAGEVNAQALAQRHGLTEDEVLRSRAAFLAGLKLGATHAPRRLRARWLVAAAAVVGTVALAQSLVSFTPNTAAMATEVNGNFQLLKTWLEQKVGPVNTPVVTVATNGKVAFGQQTRQMLDLWNSNYGIGVQANTQYYRTDFNFAWYRGGTHSDSEFVAGAGGTEAMRLDSQNRLRVGGRYMLGSSEGTLTTVRGTYDPGGTYSSNTSGFSVASCGTGCFEVTLGAVFSSPPTVLCSPHHPSNSAATAGVVQCLVSHPGQISATKFRVMMTDGANGAANWPFSFIAVGS